MTSPVFQWGSNQNQATAAYKYSSGVSHFAAIYYIVWGVRTAVCVCVSWEIILNLFSDSFVAIAL